MAWILEADTPASGRNQGQEMSLALVWAGNVIAATYEEFKTPLNFTHIFWIISWNFRISFKEDILLIQVTFKYYSV